MKNLNNFALISLTPVKVPMLVNFLPATFLSFLLLKSAFFFFSLVTILRSITYNARDNTMADVLKCFVVL